MKNLKKHQKNKQKKIKIIIHKMNKIFLLVKNLILIILINHKKIKLQNKIFQIHLLVIYKIIINKIIIMNKIIQICLLKISKKVNYYIKEVLVMDLDKMNKIKNNNFKKLLLISNHIDNNHVFQQAFLIYEIDEDEFNDFYKFLIKKNKNFYHGNQRKQNTNIQNKKTHQRRTSFIKYSQKFKFYLKVYTEKVSNSKIIRGKYSLEELVCESTFSYIYKCSVIKSDKQYSIKKIKDNKNFLDQSIFEVYILSYLKKKGSHIKFNFLDLYEFFYYNRRLYLVTELLGLSLYHAFIKPKFPLTLLSLQIIIRDVIICLKFLKEVGIIHCDLKPENILLKTNESNRVKIIDFGSAIFIEDSDQHYEMQTLPYRAPEIVLGADYDFQIDIWSLGCILYELITHKVLFNTHDEVKNLSKAMAINKVSNLNCFKEIRNTHLMYKNQLIVQNQQSICGNQLSIIIPKDDYSFDNELLQHIKEPLLVDFIKKCLILDPKQRITVENALQHPYLKKKFQFNYNQ